MLGKVKRAGRWGGVIGPNVQGWDRNGGEDGVGSPLRCLWSARQNLRNDKNLVNSVTSITFAVLATELAGAGEWFTSVN